MHDTISVDPEALRADVRDKYKDVATNPQGDFHFHTGRPLAALLGYDRAVVDALPDRAVESFAGVGNPHSVRPLAAGERVVDLGSGAGFDCFIAAQAVGTAGAVVGVDMTPEMLAKSRETAAELGLDNVEFREGILEELPVEDGWADAVISNGVINLVADKAAVFAQAYRVLRPGGAIQFADIANGKPLPEQAVCSIDLWTGCVGGGKPVGDWCGLLENAGFSDISVGPAIDAFGGSGGEKNARAFDVSAHVFLATKPE
ncbi:MAG: methyltransferase domain-containing protein [Actinobacteria bacterium]|nr:methyltransferase domain-containing protein [Actinomycetota bacterium]